MSKVIRCNTCRDIVGVYTEIGHRRFYGKCPGYGKHPKPERIEKKRALRRVEVWIFYPVTETHSHFYKWLGGPRWMLWLALLITPNHKLFDETNMKWIFNCQRNTQPQVFNA